MQEKVELSFERNVENQSSLRELVIGTRDWIRYFLSKWYLIIIITLLGAALGLAYSFVKKNVYTATTSFVLESGGARSALGNYAGIASSFGIDLGGVGGGLFEGENIIELYRSRNMISSALLSEHTINGKRQLLIEYYIDFNKLKEIWKGRKELAEIKFRSDNNYSNSADQLLHDSIITQIVKTINQSYLKVEKKDKKLNIVYIAVSSPDELFSKILNEQLVEKVNDFYLATKSKKNLENVSILQQKTDSVRGLLTGAINRAASVADATPNQNLTRMAQRVAPIQSAKVSAEVNQEVLATLLQNLELSKISLLKERPLIQIVDSPVLPLEKKKFGSFKGIVVGGFLGFFFVVAFLMIRRVIRTILTEDKRLNSKTQTV